jgi:hypothetical protein
MVCGVAWMAWSYNYSRPVVQTRNIIFTMAGLTTIMPRWYLWSALMEQFPSAATIFQVQFMIAWWLNGEMNRVSNIPTPIIMLSLPENFKSSRKLLQWDSLLSGAWGQFIHHFPISRIALSTKKMEKGNLCWRWWFFSTIFASERLALIKSGTRLCRHWMSTQTVYICHTCFECI